jgi:assimilatory nitrate reductase catalytic subunit
MLQRSLRAHFPAFDYCTCVPLWCGDDDEGALLLRAASLQPADPSRLQAIETEFGLAEPDTLRYDDSRRSMRRRLRIRGSQLIGAALAGERSALQAEAWLREWFESGLPAQLTPTQLMSSTRPAASQASRGRVVCSCMNVAEQQIRQFLSSYSGPEPESALSQALKCGTECGSCRPEPKKIAEAAATVRQHAVQSAAHGR